MRSKGRYFWKVEWYSFCSRHRDHNPDCELCKCGSWHNVYFRKIDHFIHNNIYWLWYWWHNRYNSRSRRELKKWFPNLK